MSNKYVIKTPYILVKELIVVEEELGDQVEPRIPIDDTIANGVPLRRSQRIYRLTVSNNYMIYL